MIWEKITDASVRVSRARRVMLNDPRHAFWCILSQSLAMVPDDTCERMATDGRAIFYNPAWVLTISEAECIGTIAHEVSHPALDHFRRMAGRDANLWNMAADYELNLDLVKAGFTLPDDVCLDWRFDGLSAEQIFHVIQRENDQAKDQGRPEPHQPGSDEMRAPSDDAGQPLAGKEAEDHAEAWAERTQQALGSARKAATFGAEPGTIPASLQSIKTRLASPMVDWRPILRAFIDDLGSREESWSALDRRGVVHGLALPDELPIRPSLIGWFIDVSGSMDTRANRAALSEAQAALDDGACDAIELVYVDTKVQRVERFDAGQTIAFHGANGGGTDFKSAMAMAATRDYAAMVFVTDGQTSSWGTDPACPVLWAVTATSQATDALRPPYGGKVSLYTS